MCMAGKGWEEQSPRMAFFPSDWANEQRLNFSPRLGKNCHFTRDYGTESYC